MRRCLPASLLAVIAVGLAPASAGAAGASSIARSLRSDPVYLESGARPTLSPAHAGRVRLAIVRKDNGRIKVAVIRSDSARSAGGVGPLANSIAKRARLRGTLVVIAGDAGNSTITSFGKAREAREAVRRGLVAGARKGLLVDQVLGAVDGIAKIDPGPSGDGGGESGSGGSTPGSSTPAPGFTPGNPFKGVDDATDQVVEVVTILVIALTVIPALIVFFIIFKVFQAVSRGRARITRIQSAPIVTQYAPPPPPSGPPPVWQPAAAARPPPPPPAPRPAAPAARADSPAPTVDPALAVFGTSPPPTPSGLGPTTPEVPASSLFGGGDDDSSSLFGGDDDGGSSLFGGGDDR